MNKYLYLLFLLLIPFQGFGIGYEDVALVNGEADLTKSTQGIFRVSGQAHWVWGKLIEPDDIATQTWENIDFPKAWINLPDPHQRKFGQASYQIRLKVPLEAFGEIWGMRLPLIHGASRIWVNGIELPNPTHIAVGKERNRQITSSFVHYFRIQGEWLNIVIQNSNKQVHTGGFDWDFLVSPAQRLQDLLSMLTLLDSAILGSLLFAAVYHIWLFSFRRQWLPYLILGLFFFVAMVRIGVTGAGQWALSFGLNEAAVRKLELITYYLMVILSLYNVQIIYPQNSFRRWNNLLYILGGTIVVATVFTRVSFANDLLSSFHILTLACFSTMMQIVVLSMVRRHPGSVLFFSGMMAAIACSIVDLLYVLHLIYLPFYVVGPGLMVFALLACVFQAFRFERIFQTLEVQTGDISQLHQTLEGQAQALERQVQLRTQELNAILQHTDAGVIVLMEINQQLTISPIVSQASLRMMAVDKLEIADFIGFLKRSTLDADQQAQALAALGAILGVPAFLFDMNTDLLPHKLEFKTSDQQSFVYLCSWIPQIEDDVISGILLILVDVSKEVASSQSFDAQYQKSLRLSEILNLDEVKLSIALPECREILQRIRQATEGVALSQAALPSTLMRDLHTLKGLSRAFGFKQLASVTHEAEEALVPFREISRERLKSILQPVDDGFEAYAADYQFVYRTSADDPLLHAGEVADHLISTAQAIARQAPDARWMNDWQKFQQRYFVSLVQFMESFHMNVSELATQLGKPSPHIRMSGSNCLLKRNLLGQLSGIFVHLLRNAIDHGIELPDDRLKAGKAPEGVIGIEARLNMDQLEIDIYDDGRGVDLSLVYDKAQAKGLIGVQENLTDDEIVELIFYSGFSTRSEANDISGRGIGMDAVRTMIHELGGRLQVVWRGNRNAAGLRPCAWRILLPENQFLREAA